MHESRPSSIFLLPKRTNKTFYALLSESASKGHCSSAVITKLPVHNDAGGEERELALGRIWLSGI